MRAARSAEAPADSGGGQGHLLFGDSVSGGLRRRNSAGVYLFPVLTMRRFVLLARLLFSIALIPLTLEIAVRLDDWMTQGASPWENFNNESLYEMRSGK